MRNLFHVMLFLLFLNQVKAFTQENAYTFLIIGPIAMIASLTIIIIFICLPETRKTPGDILLGLSICDFIQTLNYVVSAVYFDPNQIHKEFYKYYTSEDILLQHPSCVINGIVTTLFIIGSYLYNMAFVLTPLLLLKNNLTNKFSQINLMMHISIFFFCIIVVSLIGNYYPMILLSTSGFCLTVGAFENQVYVGMLTAYFFIALNVVHQFYQLLQRNAEIQGSVMEYMYIYRSFVNTTALLWSLQIIFITFLSNSSTIGQNIFNFITVITPIVQCVIRLQDPILRQQLRKLKIYRRFYDQNKQSVSEAQGNTRQFLSDGTSELSLTTQMQLPDIINDIQNTMRATQIYTMLAGILMINKFKSQQIREVIEGIGQFSKEDADNKSELFIDNVGVKQIFPGVHEFGVFSSVIIQYAPDTFKYLCDTDKQLVDFEESLNLFKSRDSILSSSIPSGGKSGEFFFFSWDNKLIIKTMKLSEVLTLRKRIFQYGNYLCGHPDSMISKIYGIYTLKRLVRDSIESTIHILVMRNISIGVPRKYILRTFDMKGSEYDREVLNKNLLQDPSKVTLKDLDFLKTEGKIYVQPELSEQLLSALQGDVDFFKDCQLMDYSLLVMKIDWQSYINDTGPLTQFVRKQITNPLYMIESCKEKGIFYHIAIIDYLQEWNVNKRAEQVTKKIINFDSQLEISAQNPKVYAERFKSKLVERILRITEEEKSDKLADIRNIIK